LKHEHLMAKREQLRLQVSATANQVTNGSEEGHDDGDHRSTLAQSRGMAKHSRIQLRTDFSEGRGPVAVTVRVENAAIDIPSGREA
jgi:hypothetical protein